MPLWLQELNTFLWVGSNVFVFVVGIVLVLFVIGYYVLFDPGATTAGKFVLRFVVSLVLVMGLVFLGTFVDPAPGREWYEYPRDDVLWWRPALRFIAYGYVVYSISALTLLLVYRKWFPHKLRTAPAVLDVKVRAEDHRN